VLRANGSAKTPPLGYAMVHVSISAYKKMGVEVFNRVTPIQEGMRIRCVPDFDSVLSYALGFLHSDVYRQQRLTRFAPQGEGVHVCGHLSVTRIEKTDLEEIGIAISMKSKAWSYSEEPNALRPHDNLDSRELWLVNRPQLFAFEQKETNVVIEGAALRALLDQSIEVYEVIRSDCRKLIEDQRKVSQ
jgi:hypothetical protein